MTEEIMIILRFAITSFASLMIGFLSAQNFQLKKEVETLREIIHENDDGHN